MRPQPLTISPTAVKLVCSARHGWCQMFEPGVEVRQEQLSIILGPDGIGRVCARRRFRSVFDTATARDSREVGLRTWWYRGPQPRTSAYSGQWHSTCAKQNMEKTYLLKKAPTTLCAASRSSLVARAHRARVGSSAGEDKEE